jgi:hypothetical protein
MWPALSRTRCVPSVSMPWPIPRTHRTRHAVLQPRFLGHPVRNLVAISTELYRLTVVSMCWLPQYSATDPTEMVPTAAQRVLCEEDTHAAVSVGRLSQRPKGLLVHAFTLLSRTISERVSLDRASYLHILAYFSFVTRIKVKLSPQNYSFTNS